MLKVLLARLNQGHRTAPYPRQEPTLPDRFRGLPVITGADCPDGCRRCAEACPADAIATDGQGPRIDLGSCIFCTECTQACPSGSIQYTNGYRLAARTRANLVVSREQELVLAEPLGRELRRLLGRSLKLRQVSAGGCNGCEADINVLGTVGFDLGRFGIQIVASPRHADGLIITGPVTENMKLALAKTYDAVPSPKIVIAVGACAISGGVYAEHPEAHRGADSVVPVDLYIPGCPPNPYTILDGLLRLLGRLPRDPKSRKSTPDRAESS